MIGRGSGESLDRKCLNDTGFMRLTIGGAARTAKNDSRRFATAAISPSRHNSLLSGLLQRLHHSMRIEHELLWCAFVEVFVCLRSLVQGNQRDIQMPTWIDPVV